MATGRIFKISKEQAGSYELLKAPRMRRVRKARSNPGVTAIMGISNPARSNRTRATARKPAQRTATKRVAAKRPAAKRAATRRGPAKLRAVKKTTAVGGINCLAKPAAKYRRQGLTKRSQYALPQCFRYPVQTKTGKPSLPRIRRALSYYGRYKSQYSKAVRDQIERGIAKAARDAGLESPKAMQYRRKFGLANSGENSMIVMRKNAARKKPQRKSYKNFSEFVIFPARGKGARGVSGYAGASYKPKKKATKKKVAKKNLARGKRIVVGPEPKNKNSKAWRSWRGRRGAAIRAGQLKPTAKKVTKKAPAKKSPTKRAPAKKAPAKKAAKKVARKTTARKPVTATRLAGRTGALRVRRVSRPGSGSFAYLEVTGAKRVNVRRGTTSKKRGKTMNVAVKNINGKPSTWYKNKTRAVANLMRSYARANEAMTDDPLTWGRSVGGLGAGIRRQRGEAEMEGASWGDSTSVAAAAAAKGVAPQAFSTVKDFEKWLQHMLKSSPKFRGVYASWLRKKYRAKSAAASGKKKAKKMVVKKAPKKRTAKSNARRPTKRTTAKRKARTNSAQCKKLRGKGKASKRYMSCISRLPKRRKAAARRPAKKNTAKRRARRNMGMKARANQMFARVTALAKPTAFLLAGMVAHRMLTNLGTKFLDKMLNSPMASNVVSNLGVLALGAAASQKALPANATLLSMGMAVDAGLSIIGAIFPDVKDYLGLGVLTENTRTNYVLNGMGQPILQAAAGMGQPILQAAAGPMGAYYTPMGEYVSNDVYQSGGDFGEYVASQLDVQGYGDYEIDDTYGMSGGGYMDDGVRPDSDLSQQFAIMEAKAGVGQPIMQAAAGLPTASTYIPSQSAGIVRSSESAYDAGIFDIGGGNGVLS